MIAVIYIINSLISTVPANFQLIEKNNMKQYIWTMSEELMNDLEIKNYELDKNIIDNFYTYYISKGEEMDSISKIKSKVSPVIITEEESEDGSKGTLVFEKSSANPIEVTFTIKDSKLNSTEDATLYEEGDSIKIGIKKYTIKKIDKNNNYAILEYTPQGIQTSIISVNKYIITRYSTYDGFLTEINIEYVNREN